jgi:two-component system C4-dicarboxylate transport response regulator DctD
VSAAHLGTVLFVDDDPDIRAANAQSLELAGFRVHPCESADAALRGLDRDFPGVLVSDLRMPGIDGRGLFRRVQALDAEIPTILITGHADVAEAVAAMREGAYDFIAKPYAAEVLVESVRRAQAMRSLALENRRLRAIAARAQPESPLLGSSPAAQALRATALRLAAAEVDVLIEGETGVGKELLARSIGADGAGRHAPFVVVDCAALPAESVERELFGYEPGAFPGAARRRSGRVEAARRGTLFLDNVESAVPALQTALLRVIESREIQPLGSDQPRRVPFRAIAAANVELGRAVEAGEFRRDLYYRLDVVRIRVPPLRARREDVPLLFGNFAAEAARRFRRPVPALDDHARAHLLAHDWPGNVRELRNYAERFVLGLETPPDELQSSATTIALPERLRRFEEGLLREALASSGGDVAAALRGLGIPRKTFYDKLQRHGLRAAQFRRRPPDRRRDR